MSPGLSGVKLFLLDLDGVVVRGSTPIEGAAEAIQMLRRSGVELIFTTNNSTRSREELADLLRGTGIDVKLEDLLTTAYSAAQYALGRGWRRVYLIGERGLCEECVNAGLEVVDGDDDACDVVIVGLDRGFTYKKLKAAMKHILRGAEFIATNTDSTLPTEAGEIPGAGAMVSSLEVCSRRKPLLVLGKPNTYLMDLALKRTRRRMEECCIVGDRPETDIAMAKRVGCLGVLVLTGVANSDKRDKYPPTQRPDLIFPSLIGLARCYEASRRGQRVGGSSAKK